MNSERTESTTSEPIIITALCFGWAIALSTFIALTGFKGREFSDARLLSNIAIELVLGGSALILLHRWRYSISALYPSPSLSGLLIGLGLYVAAAFAGGLLAAASLPFASWNPVERLMKAAQPTLAIVVPAAVVNGAYEEIFLLGFFMRGLRRHGSSIALGFPLLIRVLYHTYQGPVGAISVFGYGLVAGVFYLRTSALFPVVFSHILGDIVPFALIHAIH
jgi:membrane protease YdiL (CAAX protease family)